ncbi:RluA family pseudouridine synthase [Anoxybacillus flavithermus]|uniref:Pseudouridine synthase n=1 Tax=Anoxybacillus flavithermus TaxID=33934 RepID=A0A2G5RSM3_9BACL|nr:MULTISPECIES: RluA family pseudouridine synthase [Anoxybacillus]KFZ43856.1 pseudouridine synthase [Anoxybacillus sp. KU2-6(11)]PIC05828.1 RluA family pseudouridine synthase [Anoxybacillus flavithermus]
MFQLRWIVTQQQDGMLVREFLKQQHISKTALTDIKFQGGRIEVNDVPVTVRYVLKAGDEVCVSFPPEQKGGHMVAEPIPLAVVYEDDYVIVINKPPHMSTIPSREHPHGTLANALLYHYEQQQLQTTVHVVTRLDRDTSGLVLVAKHRHVHHLLSEQQKQGRVKRRYEAICHGYVTPLVGTIDASIGRKGDSIIEREVRPDGQRAVTHYAVLRYKNEMTHVSIQLETGRTHQIRVHFSHIGHPLVGDDLYGGLREHIDRQALHSCELTFFHPFFEKTMTFHAPLPDDIARLL